MREIYSELLKVFVSIYLFHFLFDQYLYVRLLTREVESKLEIV